MNLQVFDLWDAFETVGAWAERVSSLFFCSQIPSESSVALLQFFYDGPTDVFKTNTRGLASLVRFADL